jgi:hypothetical protein
MLNDEERRLIEGARLRQAQGQATALDRWRIQVAEQRAPERQSLPVERGFTEAEGREWNEWLQQYRDRVFEDRIKPAINGAVDAIGKELDELYAENEKLRLELAELRGEIRGMRVASHSTLISPDGKLLRNGRDAH